MVESIAIGVLFLLDTGEVKVKAVLRKGYADSLSILVCFDKSLNAMLFGIDEQEILGIPSDDHKREFFRVILR